MFSKPILSTYSHVEPIKPSDVNLIPSEEQRVIIDIINKMLLKRNHYDGVTIHVENIINKYVDECHKSYPTEDLNYDEIKHYIFDNHLLDIEPFFRNNGWHVVYDKPGYNEFGMGYFIFSVKDKLNKNYRK